MYILKSIVSFVVVFHLDFLNFILFFIGLFQVKFTEAAAKQEIYEKLQRLVDSQRIESHKDLLDWTISTWARVAGIQQEPINMDTNQGRENFHLSLFERG